MTADPTAAAALRVPRSYADGLYIRGEQSPASRVGAGVVVSVDSSNLCTVLINDEEITGVMWLGTVAPRVDDVVEVEMRGDLLVIPAINDLDTFLEGMANDAEHIVSDTDPGAPPAAEIQIGSSMRGLEAWEFLGTDTANWVRELGSSGQGMRAYQTGQPTLVARNLATIPSGEAGIGPNDAGYSWTALETQSNAYSGTAVVESSTEQAFASSISIKATWVPNAKPSNVVLRVGGHTVGQQYTARVYVYVPTGSQSPRLVVQGLATSPATTAVKDAWTALTVTYTATAPEHVVGTATPAATATLAGVIYLDAFSIVAGAVALSPYFDGSSASSATEKYLWTGTPHLSTSEHWTGPVVPSVLLGTNLLPNPSFETNTTGWGATRAAVARVASATAKAGGYVGRVTNDGSASTHYLLQSPRGAATPGQVNTFSAYVRLVSGSGVGYYPRVYFYDAAVAGVGTFDGPVVDLPADGSWTRLTITTTAPPLTAFANFTISSPVSGAATDVWEVDALLVESGTAAHSYFDGDTADTEGNNYQWTGTAHASTSTWRTLPVGNPPGTTATLWSETFFDVSPGDTIGFSAAFLELANAPTAQLVVSYGSDEGTEPLPTDPTSVTVTMGAAVTITGAAEIPVTRTTVVPGTVTFAGPGAVEPKTARLGIKFTGNATGTAQALVLKATATLTPKGWPLGSEWFDPDAETGGLVTIVDDGGWSTAVANDFLSTTVDTPIPGAKKAVVTAPATTGGIAIVTFFGMVAFRSATSALYLKLIGPGNTLLAFIQTAQASTVTGTMPFQLVAVIPLTAGQEVEVVPKYAYSGTGVTTAHGMLRPALRVEFYPGAVASAVSTDPMLRYWDGDSWRPDVLKGATVDVSQSAGAVAPAKLSTTTTLDRSASSLNEGATLTLTSTTTAGAAGAVTFYRSASSSGPWTSLGTATITSTKATKTWTAEGGSWYFKATYGGNATYLTSSSAATPVTTVGVKVTKTVVIPCVWAQSYQGNGAKLTGTSADNAVQQGWASTTHGNRRALLRFDTSGIPAAAEVTSVSLVCKAGGWDYWENGSDPVLVVGSFNNTPTAPTTYISTDKYPDRSRIAIPTFHALGGAGGFTANISSWAKVSVKAAIFSGILIGPAPSDSNTWWGYSDEPGKDQFTLKVVYEVYE